MAVVLTATARPRLAPWTGVLAGSVVALWITLVAPVSGASMNPARTFASAALAARWGDWWVYFIAPPLGMLAAAELQRVLARGHAGCAKLHHPPDVRCIFCGQPGASRMPEAGDPTSAAMATATAPVLGAIPRGPGPGTFTVPGTVPGPDPGTFTASAALEPGSRHH